MSKYSKCPVCDKKGLYATIGHAYRNLSCRYCKASWATHSSACGVWIPMPQCKRIQQEKDKYRRNHRPPIDPTALQITELFVDTISRQLCTTAFCLDLAGKALGWELAGNPKEARRAIKKAIINF